MEEEKRITFKYIMCHDDKDFELSWKTFAGIYLSIDEAIQLSNDIREEINKFFMEISNTNKQTNPS